jgi:hypothetical protein
MRSFTVFATASLAALAVATPEPVFGSKSKRDGTCMSASDAQQVATNFGTLLTDYTDELANATLTEGFDDYTSSVATLIDNGCTGPQSLTEVTFAGRAAFEAAQSGQPAIPFEQLNLWYNCDTVFLRWRTALTPEFVTGIAVIETVPAPAGSEYAWLLNTLNSEFNVGAWLVDLGAEGAGGFTPTNCSSSTKRMLRA